MMEHIHIPDGIVAKLLLAGLVVASGVIGAVALSPTTSHAVVDGHGNDPATAMFPINNVTASWGAQAFSLDGKGNDVPLAMFPIDNVTAAFPSLDVDATGAHWDVTEIDLFGRVRIDASSLETGALAYLDVSDELSQDMDPY